MFSNGYPRTSDVKIWKFIIILSINFLAALFVSSFPLTFISGCQLKQFATEIGVDSTPVVEHHPSKPKIVKLKDKNRMNIFWFFSLIPPGYFSFHCHGKIPCFINTSILGTPQHKHTNDYSSYPEYTD